MEDTTVVKESQQEVQSLASLFPELRFVSIAADRFLASLKDQPIENHLKTRSVVGVWLQQKDLNSEMVCEKGFKILLACGRTDCEKLQELGYFLGRTFNFNISGAAAGHIPRPYPVDSSIEKPFEAFCVLFGQRWTTIVPNAEEFLGALKSVPQP